MKQVFSPGNPYAGSYQYNSDTTGANIWGHRNIGRLTTSKHLHELHEPVGSAATVRDGLRATVERWRADLQVAMKLIAAYAVIIWASGLFRCIFRQNGL